MKMSTIDKGCRKQKSLGHAVLTKKTSLLLPEEMPFEEWKQVGQKILSINESSTWWLGDWLVYGQQMYRDRYRRAIDGTGLDYQTLRNYAWVAGRIPASRRRTALSFQHHAEVAALSEREQEAWLEKAERLNWSRNQLRRALRAARASDDTDDTEIVRIRVEASSVRMKHWQDAADHAKQDLIDWITVVLDWAANTAPEFQAIGGPAGWASDAPDQRERWRTELSEPAAS